MLYATRYVDFIQIFVFLVLLPNLGPLRHDSRDREIPEGAKILLPACAVVVHIFESFWLCQLVSDVRRRLASIGRRARAHYAIVLRACAALAAPLKVAEAHECIGNGVTRYLPSSSGMPTLKRESAVRDFCMLPYIVNASLYRSQFLIFTTRQDNSQKFLSSNWRQSYIQFEGLTL